MKATYPRVKNASRSAGLKKALRNSLALRLSGNNDFFRLMAENSHDIIFHARYLPSFAYDYVSQSCARITGYTPEEFYADPFLPGKCIPPEDFGLLKDPYDPRRQDAVKPVVIRWRHKGGRTIWLEHYITIKRNLRGHPETCLIIARDITKRKLAEEALQIEKSKYQSVINAMTDDLTIQDRDFNIIFQNERARASSGGDHVGEKCYRIYENCEEVCEDCPVQMAFKDGQPHSSERKRLLPSGTLSFWETVANPITGSNGKVLSCLVVGHDITERKKSEKALQDSQKFAASLLENAPHATVVINPDTSVRYVNPAWERLNGWTLAEAVGMKAPYPWWPKELTEDFIPTYLEVIRQPVGQGEIAALKKNGDSYWIDMNWVSVTEEGEFRYAIINSVDITERKKAEEKRQAILKTALDGFCITDLEGRFLEVNDSYCAMTGYTREEVLKMSIKDIDGHMSSGQLSAFSETIRKQGYALLETKHRCKDGRLIDIEIKSKYYDAGNGQVFSFIRNITERIKFEQALKESEEKFSKVFHATPVPSVITSIKDGTFVDVNEAYILNTGYSRKEILGRTATDLGIWAHPADRDNMFKVLSEQGTVRNLELDFRMKSGEIRTWLFSAEPINVGGEPCLIGVSFDITERKLMEESLANEAIRRRILIEQSRDGIVILDQSGAVYEANHRFAEMLGYTHEEVTKLHVWDWEYLYPREQVVEMIRTVDEAGDHFETRHLRKDGSVYDVEISTNGAEFAGQKLIFCVCRDITERKKAEEKRQAILQTAIDGFCICSPEGKFLEVNDSYCDMTGYTREEMLKMSLADVEAIEKPDDVLRRIEKIIEQGSDRFETRHRRRDGDTLYIEISVTFHDTDGGQLYVCVRNITERKKFEQALRESEEKFSAAFHSSPGSISISRFSDGEFIEVNESFLRDKGYTREEVIGSRALAGNISVNPENGRLIKKMLEEGKKVHNEIMRYRTRSGFIRTGLVSAEIINIGNEPCMLVLNNDITQQKQAEEQLRLLSSVTQQVSDSIIITDPHFKITYMNKAAQDLLGYTLDEAIGKELPSFDVDPHHETRKQISAHFSQSRVWCETIPKKCKDGRVVICDCRLSPLYDETGSLCSYIDVQRDVTDSKAVEAKLHAQRQLVERILATMREGVLVTGGNDNVILANESAHNIFHLGKNGITNKPLKDVLPVESLLRMYNDVKLGKPGSRSQEFRYRVKNIDKIIVCVAIKMDDDRTLLTFTDVSREREEEEKLYLTDRLASIGEMAAGLAHELNNPLTGILSLSALLMDSDLPEESREDIQCINSEAKRAANIVKNVLLFTRNNSYENGRASVNEAVRDVLRLREHEVKTGNIKVVTNLQENLPQMLIDKYQLQQVFLNIILNAEAAIKEAGRAGVLTITTEKLDGKVRVSVTDNGCGIKKQILPRIFDPFFTTKEIGKGTGLGLSICYGIVSKHGGKIDVSTRVNGGTTFTITIPSMAEVEYSGGFRES